MIRQHLDDRAETCADFVCIFRRHPFQRLNPTRACREGSRKSSGVARKLADGSSTDRDDKFLMQVLATQAT
jgi:hypothetical protein